MTTTIERPAKLQERETPDLEIIEAATEYIRLRDRITNPRGTFDGGGRFYLDDSERHECCDGIRTPSRRFPYSEMVHARTAIHVAAMHGLEPKSVRRAAKVLDTKSEIAKIEAAYEHDYSY